MADNLLVVVPHEQLYRASSILKQIGTLNSDGTKMRAVRNVMRESTYSWYESGYDAIIQCCGADPGRLYTAMGHGS